MAVGLRGLREISKFSYILTLILFETLKYILASWTPGVTKIIPEIGMYQISGIIRSGSGIWLDTISCIQYKRISDIWYPVSSRILYT